MVLRHLIIALCLAALVACGQASKDVSTTPASSGPVPASTPAPGPDDGKPASPSDKKPTNDEGTLAPATPAPAANVDVSPLLPVCGNGKVETGEVCDDGNVVPGDGCTAICGAETCSDGIVQSGLGEECDGSNLNGSSCATYGYALGSLSCGGTCKFVKTGCSNPPPAPVCGNGAIETGEQCDDGNTVSSDGCSSACKTESCGDNIVQSGLGEECDGSNLNGSSCATFGYSAGSLSCGGTCKFVKTGCSAVCGNGTLETGEQCDDGNLTRWDGCDALCKSEAAPTLGTEFTSNGNLWDLKNQATGSVTFNAIDAAARDQRVVQLLFPGNPALGSGDNKGPGFATQISTKQNLAYGVYRVRVKFATCTAGEEVVNGVFLYSDGGDTNANGITDNNEIDFEVLCGEPQYLWMSSWTDYDVIGGVETFRKVTRVVNMETGDYYETVPGKEGDYGIGPKKGTLSSAITPGFAKSGYFLLGLDWKSTSLRFFMENASGQEVPLWTLSDATYPGGASYIPKNAASFMFNTWHTDGHWWAGGAADYPAGNAVMSVDWFRYWAN